VLAHFILHRLSEEGMLGSGTIGSQLQFTMPDPAQGHKGLTYRPDVDGLRAVAVSLVVLYHVGSHFYGGFIGVDVFFVISGYLISSVILSDISAGRFSISGFYERRIRRILPALLVMMILTSVLVWHYFIPQEIEAFGRSQLAALFSVSNFLFWAQSGYFDSPSLVKPLLHTWSLAVEEQFYIVFPLLILFVRRFFPGRMRSIICGLALVSFLASAITVYRDPTAAFFFAPLRAWELLTGTIISQKYLPSIKGTALRNLASATGLLLILASSHYLNDGVPFPGVAALGPCLGAGLIIAAGETGPSIVGKILSLRPIVFLGLISYSLYLWHWPLLVFQRTSSLFFHNADMTPVQEVTFCLITVAVAALSWKFVEQPFRKGRLRPGRRALLYVNGWAVGLIACASLGMIYFHGFPNRFPISAQQVAAYADYDRTASTREGVCFLDGHTRVKDFRKDVCLAQHPGKNSVLLLGDSHAAQLLAGLVSVFPDRDILQANVAGCRPLVVEPRDAPAECLELNSFIFNQYLQNHHIDTVILAGQWAPSDMDPLAQTIDFIQARGISVIVVGPAVEYDEGLPRMLAIAIRNGDPDQVAQHRAVEPQRLDKTMANLAETRWHIPYISIYQNLCTPACPLYAAPGVPILFDSNHFTTEGSVFFAKTMVANKELR
jgi:peptidoglycan/LPS O-acetylase OafA/YrhL